MALDLYRERRHGRKGVPFYAYSMQKGNTIFKGSGFDCCFPSTHDWLNRIWLKFIVLVLQSDWPVLFKSDPGNTSRTVTSSIITSDMITATKVP